MNNTLQLFREKDKFFLFKKLLKLIDVDIYEQYFSAENLKKIELIKEKGFLNKYEIKRIESFLAEKTALNNIISLEKSMIDNIKKRNQSIDDLFLEHKTICYIKLSVLKSQRRFYVSNPFFYQKILNYFFPKKYCFYVDLLFKDECGDYKSRHNVDCEILNIENEIDKSDKMEKKKKKFLKTLLKILNKKTLNNEVIKSIYELNIAYDENNETIYRKNIKIGSLDVQIKELEKKIPSINLKRYTAEGDVMSEYFTQQKDLYRNKYQEIKNKIENSKETLSDDGF
jgi:hypothetical protein